MVTNTDRLGLGTYSQGETDWDHTDAVQLLDELAVLTDTKSNRPNGTYNDELFFATDESILYRWDGSNWQAVGGLGQDGSWIPIPTFFSEANAQELQGHKWANQNYQSGSGTQTDPYVLDPSILSGYHGRLNFGKGWFEVDGLATDNIDWAETSPYFEGDGIRTTTVRHAADAPDTPTIQFNGSAGNFGGIRDMTVYGAGYSDKSGTANIVDATAAPIDYQFENVIFRFGGGDALAVNASGTRIQNAWLENVGGRCLYISGGERCKVSDVHMISPDTSPGLEMNGTRSDFSNISAMSLNGNTAIRVTSGGNKFSNVTLINGMDNGIRTDGGENMFSNVQIEDCDGSGLYVAGGGTRADHIALANWGSGYGMGMRVFSDDFIGHNIHAYKSESGYSNQILEIEGVDNTYINGLGGAGGNAWTIDIASGSTNTVLENVYNVAWANITDEGTRTLINGFGTNSGDPNSTGQWNGFAGYAGDMGATIWDTSTSPWTKYEATPNGDWV